MDVKLFNLCLNIQEFSDKYHNLKPIKTKNLAYCFFGDRYKKGEKIVFLYQ